MNSYELARLLPSTWEYDGAVVPGALLMALVIVIAPLVIWTLGRLGAVKKYPCGEPPSLPALPVKRRLA